MTELGFVMVGICLVAIGGCLGLMEANRRSRRGKTDDLPRFTLRVSVEVDCRVCGQQNRVPGERLRDRPQCGGCKKPLMPGARITICHAHWTEIDPPVAVKASWMNSDRLWGCLADHVDSEAARGR